MIRHIITRIFNDYTQFSQKLEDKNILAYDSWVMFSTDSSVKVSFIFLNGGRLILSENGNVQDAEAKWQLINDTTILIHSVFGHFLYKKVFLDKNFLVFEKDNSEEKIVLMNETQAENKQLHSFEDIQSRLHKLYVQPKLDADAETKRRREEEEKNMGLRDATDKQFKEFIRNMLIGLIVLIIIYLSRNLISLLEQQIRDSIQSANLLDEQVKHIADSIKAAEG